TDLERLALWLTVETPDLRPYISSAVDVVQGVSSAPFWREANAADERHVEVPYAIRQTDSSGLPTVVRGGIDLVTALVTRGNFWIRRRTKSLMPILSSLDTAAKLNGMLMRGRK